MEKEMATHSGVLAWRIPGTGEPGGLPSMGSHRVGHDWSDLAAAVIYMQRREWHPTPVLLPRKSHGRRRLERCSPWGRRGSDTTEWLHFHFSLSCIGGGNGNPLQCSCLENPRDRGAWWAAVYGVAQSQRRLKQFSSSSTYTQSMSQKIKVSIGFYSKCNSRYWHSTIKLTNTEMILCFYQKREAAVVNSCTNRRCH